MLDKQDLQFEDKKFLAHKADRAKNTDILYKKLEELKPKDYPEIPKFPEEVKVKLEGIEVITLKGDKGDKGDEGEKGDTGPQGLQGKTGKDSKVPGPKGDRGEPGKNGKDGIDGTDGTDGKNGKDGSPDTPQQIIKKIRRLGREGLVVKDIADIEDFANGFLEVAKGFAPRALASLYDVNSSGVTDGQTLVWKASQQKWIPGTASSTSSGFTLLNTTDVPDGSIQAFTFLTATAQPSLVSIDGAFTQAIDNLGITQWTWDNGTKTVTLINNAPTASIFAVA